jgi:hypothetical protein
MMSLAVIEDLAREAADRARGEGLGPVAFDAKTVGTPYPFQFIGTECDEVDRTNERVATLFCDSSGFGSPGEPALTGEQLQAELIALQEKHGPLTAAIEQVGQFQLYLAVWKA